MFVGNYGRGKKFEAVDEFEDQARFCGIIGPEMGRGNFVFGAELMGVDCCNRRLKDFAKRCRFQLVTEGRGFETSPISESCDLFSRCG